VGACIGAGLVGGEGFAVDASLIVADANKQRSTPGPRWNKKLDAEAVSRATKEYLATLDDARLSGATTTRPTPTWWSLVTAFSLIYRELPANYGIRTTSPLALNKDGLFARDGEYISTKWSAST